MRIGPFLFERRDIGDYMHRWIVTLPGGATIRLHRILREDVDEEFHDHPFSFVSLVLRGWYVEERPRGYGNVGRAIRHYGTLGVNPRPLAPGGDREAARRGAGSLAFRSAEDPHRIIQVSPGGVWTLVVSGPRRRTWGFWTARGWVRYTSFATKKPGNIVNAPDTVGRP